MRMDANRFFYGKKVLVTGAAGLVGSAFVEELLELGACVRTVRHVRPLPFQGVEGIDGDLRDFNTCLKAAQSVDVVIHAAGVSGGSKKVTVQAIPMFTDNLLMNTQMLEASRLQAVERYLFISNSSVYARSEAPLREEDAWGETSLSIPENETGMVKRAGETQCGLYSKFTPMRIAIMRAGNAYGPWDDFNLETSHVMPALLRKAAEKQDPFEVWGDGMTVRDFIYSRDIARGGLFLLERAVEGSCFPVNVASGSAVRIRELVELILKLAGHEGARVRYTQTAPPASPVKVVDISRMKSLGFRPQFTLEEGLRATLRWYAAIRAATEKSGPDALRP